MARQTTRIWPATCGCSYEYAWDDAVPAEIRVHTPFRLHAACARHAGLTLPELHAAVHDEMRAASQASQAVAE